MGIDEQFNINAQYKPDHSKLPVLGVNCVPLHEFEYSKVKFLLKLYLHCFPTLIDLIVVL